MSTEHGLAAVVVFDVFEVHAVGAGPLLPGVVPVALDLAASRERKTLHDLVDQTRSSLPSWRLCR